ncbi:MAG: hypothetical protein IK088_07045 [Lachnospiraceae bacterium]|nr:hypothetical protein [Lachnospiraceae bacterium]
MAVFLPILFSAAGPCVYDDTLLGLSREEVASEWDPVYRQDDDSIAIESHVYGLWQRENEQMAAVFQNGKLCDYMIRYQRNDTLRGSVSSGYGTLPLWFRLRFGMGNTGEHHYDVGSGTTIDSWLTNDGKIIVWWDSAETWVRDAFTLKNSSEFILLTGLNYFINLPYTLFIFLT